MRKITFVFALFFSTLLYAQKFDKKWDKVIALEQEGKIRSANTEVQQIYQKAKSRKDDAEIVKAFFYASKYMQTLEEDASVKIIADLKQTLSKSSIPTQALLQHIYAKCLETHLSKNYNTISRLTYLEYTPEADFRTWPLNIFKTEIQTAYQKSIEAKAELQKTPLRNYEIVFDFEKHEDFKKHTLYDYLASEVITYYKKQITFKADFQLTEKEKNLIWDTSDLFLKTSFDTLLDQDIKNIIQLYQKLEKNELLRPKYQFERLKYFINLLRLEKQPFLKRLTQFQKQKLDTLTLQNVLLEKASIYKSQASKTINPDYNRLAMQTYDSILTLGMSSAYKEAFNDRHQLSLKSFSISLPKQLYDKQNTRASIDYKNIDNLTVSFYKIDSDHTALLHNSKPKEKDRLKDSITQNQKPVITKTYALPNKNDYFTYTTEILFPVLETGTYLTIFENKSQNGTITKSDDILSVTDISLLSYTKNKTLYFEAYHRKTGQPLENVKISSEDFQIQTDAKGHAHFKLSDNYASFDYILATKDQDLLYLAFPGISYSSKKEEDHNQISDPKIKLFLDRAIYRPGQTVYYKGIATWKKKEITETIADLKVKVFLDDPNGGTIKEIETRTNEFGSFSGEFQLPKNGLTGNYTISFDEPEEVTDDPLYDSKKKEHPFWDKLPSWQKNETEFNVEEYKRPNFQITFDPVQKPYTVNQKIEIKGTAKAFSGSNISNAKVSYTISRSVVNKYNDDFDDSSLLEGETQTDANGNFVVAFTAEPDPEYTVEELPVYTYTADIDITDSNGETRSNKTAVKAGYHQLVLQSRIPSVIETDKKEFISLNSTNLNENFVPTKGTLEFYYMAPIANKWKNTDYNPEIKLIDDTVFDSLFPYDKRSDDSEKILILKKNVDTKSNRMLLMDFISNWKTGLYKAVFTAKDSSGHVIESISDFRFFQVKDKQRPSDKLFTVTQLNQSPLKDGYITIAVASNFANLYLTTEAYYKGTSYYTKFFQLKNQKAILQIPVNKNFEKEIKLQFSTVFDNQVIKTVTLVTLQKETEKLAFEVESIRNKIEPGSHENWAFRIKNKTETEVLASMYDSSLDQFTQKDWDISYNENYYYIPFKTAIGFGNLYKSLRFPPPDYFNNTLSKQTDLIWFGFHFSNPDDPYTLQYYKKIIKTGKPIIPANSKTITGVVTEGGLPLPGVSVVVKGTKRGAQTDMDGNYSIAVVAGEMLQFDFVGMKTASVVVTKSVHNVAMIAEAKALNEVVVGAMGIKRREEGITSANQIISAPIAPNVLQALSGKVNGLQISQQPVAIRGIGEAGNKPVLIVIDGKIADASMLETIPASDLLSSTVLKGAQGTALYGSEGANGVLIITTKKSLSEIAEVKTRRNFNETAFFYPHLKADKDGRIKFSFTSPEALTKWKLRLLGHTKQGKTGYYEDLIVTQKDLMITPNFPRFLREKDTLFISAKIANMTYEAKSGIAALQLFDATTMQPIDAKMDNQNNLKNMVIPAKGNTEVRWKIVIPEGIQGVQYKVVAKTGNFSDGEENILPVLANTQLVTESIPLWVRGNTTKTYTLDNLKTNTSTTLQNHQITLEYTSNPTWLALQSLPYLMEYEHECAEQTFARYYANVLASQIINSNPKIASLFESWRKDGKSFSKLEQNEQLKSIILAETPWFRDSQSGAEKKKNLALLFDLDKMATSTAIIFDKLKQKQKPSGGFSWFENGDENYYITRHIMAGFGHLSKMQLPDGIKKQFTSITNPGIQYLDSKFEAQHNELLKQLQNPLYYENLYYLYTRSFYLDSHPLTAEQQKIVALYLDTSKKNWLRYSLYEKGLAALVFNRFNDPKTAETIISSLKETAVNNSDSGMYWISNKSGWFWYQAPIETQALLIEAFAEITTDKESIEAMKVWLLKNKQNQNWPTTKATTEAIYALLFHGNNFLSKSDNTVFKIGSEKILSKKLGENQKEAETGYIKLNWSQQEITPEMATISVTNKSDIPGYGGYYWQYFEDLDKIKTQSGSTLSTSKELYLKKTSKDGTQLERIQSDKPIKIGDLVTVRIIITATEDLEYIHLKDMRASGFEPLDVLSGYQWKHNISYYQSTRDAATHFFFDQIRKGVYVIEYDVRANNSGNFSNGITTIQSMYAPEFTSHTKGIRVQIQR